MGHDYIGHDYTTSVALTDPVVVARVACKVATHVVILVVASVASVVIHRGAAEPLAGAPLRAGCVPSGGGAQRVDVAAAGACGLRVRARQRGASLLFRWTGGTCWHRWLLYLQTSRLSYFML